MQKKSNAKMRIVLLTQGRKNMSKFALLIGLVALLPTVAQAEEISTLNLTGTGVVKVQPDEGYITVGMVTRAKKSALAVRENSVAMSKLFATLKAKGVKEQNIQTVDFTLAEVYKQVWVGKTWEERDEDDPKQKTQKSVRDGYIVRNIIHITVCELDKFGEVLDALVEDGANTVHSIHFGYSKSKDALDRAREEAVADAARKSKFLTAGLGVKTGKVLSISESVGGGPRPMYSPQMAAAERADNVPVSGGSLSFSVTVSIRWELEPLIKMGPGGGGPGPIKKLDQ